MNQRVLSVVGEFGLVMMTEVRGASSAKRDPAWRWTYPETKRWVPLGLGSVAHTKERHDESKPPSEKEEPSDGHEEKP